MREYLEKNYTDELAASDDECQKLAIKSLLEVLSSTLCSGSEAGSYLRLIDFCITQL